MTLYELTGQYAQLQELIENGVEDDDLTALLNEINDQIEVKADNYARLIKNIEGDVEAIKNEEKRLADKRKTYENRISFLKSNLFNSMQETGKTKFKTELFSFQIQRNGGVAPLIMKVDVDKLPINLIKKDADMTAIRKYIEETGDLTYAELGERGESLRIR